MAVRRDPDDTQVPRDVMTPGILDVIDTAIARAVARAHERPLPDLVPIEPMLSIDGLMQATPRFPFTLMITFAVADPLGIERGELITVWCPGFAAVPAVGTHLEFSSDIMMKVELVRMQPSSDVIAINASLETLPGIVRIHEVFDRYTPPPAPTPKR